MAHKKDMGETIPDLLPSSGSTALIGQNGQLTLSASEVAANVETLAGRLRRAGIERGHRVCIALPPGPVFVQTLLAVTALGATAAPLNPAYTASEFRFYLDDLRPRCLLAASEALAAARRAADELALPVVDLVADSRTSVYPVVHGTPVEATSPFEGAAPDDVAIVLHTSGTTSRAKQVPLLHRNVVASTLEIARHYQLGPHDVSYAVMPLFHVHGMIASVLAPLATDGSVVLPARMSGRAFWSALAQHGITWYSASPTVHRMLLDQQPTDHSRTPPALRFLRSCSASLPLSLRRRLENRFGVPVIEAYGMTEASHQITSHPLNPAAVKPGTVGLPTGTEVRIVDHGGNLVGTGGTGEVLVRGPGLTPGYLNNAAANAEVFINGWFRTGDLGRIDADGHLELHGRIKELINRGGENISPYEIEDVLAKHPAVKDALCFGVPDDKYGEVVAAAVTLARPTSEAQLRAYLRTHLALFKVPNAIYVVEEIPRTATGKPQRQRMLALLSKEVDN